MTQAYDELAKALKANKKITPEDIEKAEKEHGSLTDDERVRLAAELHELESKTREGEKISVEQYIEAAKIVETAKEGSEEYKKAQRIVDAFESAA